MSNENLESKRWLIAGAAIVMQLCLGTVYAWSVFKKPLMGTHGWAETPTQLTFMILMLVIGCSAAFGGTLVDKKGPRFVATIGGILFGVGTLIAGLADQMGNLYLLYLGFGIVAALGNGFGYVTPIATLIRWFPDKRGLVTGLAVMGFGAGAFFMGQIAPFMINKFQVLGEGGKIVSSGVATTFYIWGAIFLVLVTGAAQFYKNPPQGWVPAGFTPAKSAVSAADSYQFGQAVKVPQWWMLWAMLCLNVSAGLGLLSQLSPMAQDVLKKSITDGHTTMWADSVSPERGSATRGPMALTCSSGSQRITLIVTSSGDQSGSCSGVGASSTRMALRKPMASNTGSHCSTPAVMCGFQRSGMPRPR